jgi:hypothetical protein
MKPQFALLLPALAILVGCASSGPPLPPSLNLPAPVSDLRAVRKGDHVLLSWTVPTQTTDHESAGRLGPTLICRSSAPEVSTCGTTVAEVAPAGASAASYVDHLPAAVPTDPTARLTYAVEALNRNRRGAGLSNQVRVSSFPAQPPPQNFQVEASAQGVRITWSCPALSSPESSTLEYKLRIYRRAEGSTADTRVAEPDVMSCQNPVFDQNFEWEKTYEYRAAVVTTIRVPGQAETVIEGDDTPAMKLFVHDTFPPAVPAGLQAVYSPAEQGGFIDLVWSPDSEADLAGYNVYRRELGGAAEKLNSELVKTPAYRDTTVNAHQKYLYSVSAVDVRGNESEKSQEEEESVP